jgi:hypothetical protein
VRLDDGNLSAKFLLLRQLMNYGDLLIYVQLTGFHMELSGSDMIENNYSNGRKEGSLWDH